jgi:NTE family protein
VNHSIAFVLSGGGNHGALQVGALRALLEHGVKPALIIGTSAGAINAAYFAARPTLQGVYELENIWREVKDDDVYPGNRLQMLWRLVSGSESIFPNQQFHQFLQLRLPSEVRTFRDLLNPQLFITSAHLDTCDLHLYGEDLDESVLEAVMASTALPPFSPPWLGADGRYHIDGGPVSDLPLSIALKKGARKIYALHITEVTMREERVAERARSMAEVGHAAVRTLLKSQFDAEFAAVKAQRDVTLHHVKLHGAADLSFRDFSHGDELIESGYQQTKAYLQALPQPIDPMEKVRETVTRFKQWSDTLAQAWKDKRMLRLSE